MDGARITAYYRGIRRGEAPLHDTGVRMPDTDARDRDRLLLLLVGLTGLGAIPAGLGLVADPTGANLGMTPDLLRRGPFTDFIVPGAFLVIVLGLGAVSVLYGLWARKAWALGGALAYGVVLLAWITIQALMIGIVSPLQPVYGTIGLLICGRVVAARSATCSGEIEKSGGSVK